MAATLKCDTIQNASSATANITLDTDGNATVGNTLAMSSSFLRNRIINGDMRIDQRNAGASVNTNNTFPVDRFVQFMSGGGVLTSQQSSTAPVGFVNSIYTTVSTADASIAAGDYYFIRQQIEGTNISDLAWGTANAATITLSFRVRSSVAGTFGGSVVNSAEDRSYPFTYSISSTNTWETKSVTIPGDTTGNWLTTTGIGMRVVFDLGSGSTRQGTANTWAGAGYTTAAGVTQLIGTLNATFYITGVQLEVGSVATPFERRMYGQELALCQRYCIKFGGQQAYEPLAVGVCSSGTSASLQVGLPVPMRTAPSGITFSTASNFRLNYGSSSAVATALTFDTAGYNQIMFNVTVASGPTAGYGARLYADNTTSASILIATEL